MRRKEMAQDTTQRKQRSRPRSCRGNPYVPEGYVQRTKPNVKATTATTTVRPVEDRPHARETTGKLDAQDLETREALTPTEYEESPP